MSTRIATLRLAEFLPLLGSGINREDEPRSIRLIKNVTSADVAQKAGVSKWTVIRAFTSGAIIANETRARVLEVAQELNYRPNLLARSLATNKTHLVAILVDDFMNPYKLPTLDRLTASLQAEGMLGVLVNINKSYDHVEALTTAKQRQLDAVVLFGTAFKDDMVDDHAGMFKQLPLFVLARESTIPMVPSVSCDAERSLIEICEYLYSRGYRRPGFMYGPRTMSTALGRRRSYLHFWHTRGIATIKEIAAEHYGPRTMSTALGRRRSYLHFWHTRGIATIKEIAAEHYDRNVAAEAMRIYLRSIPSKQRCDVIMCENDILAIGALDVARNEFGLSIPQDIAIVGYDDIDLAGMHAFSLTTYRQPASAMVEALVHMLVGRRPPTTLRIPGELIIRTSA